MDIKKALLESPLKKEVVDLKELGVKVTLQEMTAARLEQYESMIYVINDDGKMTINSSHVREKLIAFSVVDDNGNLIFSESDVEQLGNAGAGVIKKLADVAGALNNISNQEDNKKK